MISGLLEIFGWDILLMAMGIDAKAFGETATGMEGGFSIILMPSPGVMRR